MNILQTQNLTRNVSKMINLYITRYIDFSFICPHPRIISNLIIQKIILTCIVYFRKNINHISRQEVHAKYQLYIDATVYP